MTVIQQPLEFAPVLMTRNDAPAPRYPCYTMAPQCHPGFGASQMCEVVIASITHVPICRIPGFDFGCIHVTGRTTHSVYRYSGYPHRKVARTARMPPSRACLIPRHRIKLHSALTDEVDS